MSLLDSILSTMDEQTVQQGVQVSQAQAADQHAIQQQQFLQQQMQVFTKRIERHIGKLLTTNELKCMQYPPMDTMHRLAIMQVAEDASLVCFEFGEEEIDRFVIIYKSDQVPSDRELQKMDLVHTRKMTEAEAENLLVQAERDESGEKEARPAKRARAEVHNHTVDESAFRAVGTERKVVQSAVSAIQEVARKKKQRQLLGKPAQSEQDDEYEKLFTE